MKKIFYILILLPMFCIGQLSPEQEAKVDSLKQVIKTATHDTTIVLAWKLWDDIIYVSDPELDFELNKRIDSLSSLNLKKKLTKQEKINFQKAKGNALNVLGLIFKHRGDFASAINYYTKSLKIYTALGDEQGMGASLNNIGIIYDEQGNSDKSIDYYTRSLKIIKDADDKQGEASTLNNIANLYANQGDYAKAIDNYIKSLEINEEIGYQRGVAGSLKNIGEVYILKGEFDKSLGYLTKSLKISRDIGSQQGIASSLNSIGNIYKEQGDSALKAGNSKLYEDKYTMALDYNQRALKIAKEIGIPFLIQNTSSVLWKIYKKRGNYKEALYMHELFIEMRDSLESEENQKEVIRQEYKYQYEKQAAVDSIENAKQQKIAQATIKREKAENERKETVQYALFGGLALVLLFAGFMFNRFRVTRKQKGVIEEQKKVVDNAFGELEEKNTEILDSITYAKRIQSAILPPQKLVKEYLPESFIFYLPKDIVAGDFYWMEHTKDQLLFAAADCTGHGVPGAMVSVVCNNGLNRSVREYGLTEPAKILDKTREIVIQEFEKSEEEVKDGMDIALVSLKKKAQSENESESESHHSHSPTHSILQYAGAHNPLWIVRNGASEIEEIKADKQPIGKFGAEKPFTNHTVELQKGDTIYIFSDGFPDQFGGEKGKKFKSKNFKKLLLSITSEPMEKQRELIVQAFENWKGSIEQLDDVCVIGVRV